MDRARDQPVAPGGRDAEPYLLCDSVRVPSYLLRVQLEDRPGSLGSLAVALGSVGADILSLDVVERVAGYAIDDLVVDLPAGTMPDTLITAAERLAGVYVDTIRPHTGLLEAHRELELIDHIAAAKGKAAMLQTLVDDAAPPDIVLVHDPIAAEPLVQDPVQIVFDPDGRIWVVEMRGYMHDMDAKATADMAANCAVVKAGSTVADANTRFALPLPGTARCGGVGRCRLRRCSRAVRVRSSASRLSSLPALTSTRVRESCMAARASVLVVTTMSQPRTISKPPPSAWPAIAATKSIGVCSNLRNTSWVSLHTPLSTR